MREVRLAIKELSAVLSTELTSRRKILEKSCIKNSSKMTAGFLVPPRSLADSVHEISQKLGPFSGTCNPSKWEADI